MVWDKGSGFTTTSFVVVPHLPFEKEISNDDINTAYTQTKHVTSY